ncbi:hypothetical protein Tsubulata_006509 [Turnera subulata]|uniref:BHLH domain-containing protein n=1 Tax=Turnera subulata TaxID=218843 RepID=A0A9Q0F623_9ROSI|nr:hypothetical protein Tsubulata_006509 [Turnera subulata]
MNMNPFADFASSPDRGLEELLWQNGKVLARGLSTNSSCSFRSLTKSGEDSHTGKRQTLGTIDSFMHDSCLSSRGTELTKHNTALHNDHLPELSLGLMDTHLRLFLENTEDVAHDRHLTEPHVVPVYTDENPATNNASLCVDAIPELPTARNIGEPHQSSMEDIWVDPLARVVIQNDIQPPVLTGGLTNSNLQKVNSGSDKHSKFLNFPILQGFAAPGKGNGQAGGATRPTSGSRLKNNYVKPPEDAGTSFQLPLRQKSCGSSSFKGFGNRLDPVANRLELGRPTAKPSEVSPTPDEQSGTLCHKSSIKRKCSPAQAPDLALSLLANTIKGNPDARKHQDQGVSSSSICSAEASNDLQFSKRRCGYMEGLACPSGNVEEEEVRQLKQIPAGRSAGTKERIKEGRKLSERRRRNKINKKVRKLQKLLPKSDKMDQVSILDEAIVYLKDLQLRAQMMSMGTGCLPPMMLPTGMQHIQAPHLAHFSPMGMRMNAGFGYNTAPLPNPAIFGFPVLPKSVPNAPFLPFSIGQSANNPGRATPVKFQGSSPSSSSKDVSPSDGSY